jgi:Spy/CpxP family protein refolding chaperone
MRQFRGRTILAAAMVVGLAAMVAAQPPAGAGGQGMGPGMRQGMGGQGMRGMGPGGGPMGALKLTQAQRDAIQKLQEQHRADNQAKAEALRGLRDKLHTAMFEDQASAAELARAVGAAEAEMIQLRVAHQIEIINQLTPEQKKIALDLKMFGPDGMGPGGPGGMRGGRGQGPVKK